MYFAGSEIQRKWGFVPLSPCQFGMILQIKKFGQIQFESQKIVYQFYAMFLAVWGFQNQFDSAGRLRIFDSRFGSFGVLSTFLFDIVAYFCFENVHLLFWQKMRNFVS